MAKTNKIQDRRLAKQYLEKLRLIQQNDLVDYSETEQDKAQRIKRAAKDYNYFVRYYFPHYATCDCAHFHITCANAVRRDERYKGVMEWARGLAKSTHFTIFIPLWLSLFHDQMKFMVLLSATKDNAVELLADLQAELQANPQLSHDFGDLSVQGDFAEGNFRSKNGTFFLAMGKKGLRRGIRNGPYRPDYIICDDIDDDEEVENPARVFRSYQKIVRAAKASQDIGRARFLIVNNRIADYTIMTLFARNPTYKHIKVNALADDGQPNWPEKYTRQHYMNLQAEDGYENFQTEYQNKPSKEGKLFKNEYFKFAPILRRNQYDRIVAYWDIAYSESETADFNAVPIVGRYGQQRHIIAAYCRQSKMEDALRWMYDYWLSLPPSVVVEWYYEGQFWNDAVELAMQTVAEEYQNRCPRLPLIKVDNPRTNKFSRILQMLPGFQRGQWRFNADLEYDPMLQAGINQTKGIEQGYRGKDDFPDALHGASAILDADEVMGDFEPSLGYNTPSKKIF